MQVSKAISTFLHVRRGPVDNATQNADLLELWSQWSMETQVKINTGKGCVVDGRKNTYTDGYYEWWPIRIPKNAKTEPTFNDYELKWPLEEYAEAIGSTGWDYASRRSRWVGFDFDDITGHAPGHGIEADQLEKVKQAAMALPWVMVRRSTGGAGIHLYVFFEDDPFFRTENHTVHAALGRAVLGLMSSETGFDFASQIDACGGNMWIWATKMTEANQGLALIKQHDYALSKDLVPANWRDHIAVVTKKQTKTKLDGMDDEYVDPFELLASSRRVVQRDSKHKAIMDELRSLGWGTHWDSDHNLMTCHTAGLDQLIKDDGIKTRLGLVGCFETNSQGKDKQGCNAFAFPLDNGAWKVYRFSPGVSEASTWEQDGEGWTTSYFNHIPNLKIAARASKGTEDAEHGGFVFDHATEAADAVKLLGEKLTIPREAGPDILERQTRLKAHKDGRLTAMIVKKAEDNGQAMKAAGWLPNKKGDWWSKVFDTQAEKKNSDLLVLDFDNMVRCLKSPAGERSGWMIIDDSGSWVRVPKDDARSKLLAKGHAKPEAEIILGLAGEKNWAVVNMPFKPEYPGNRQWNLNAAQYAFKPVELSDDEQPHHPHWDSILKHCGQDLDDVIKTLDWAKKCNIRSGADYLLHWAACMLREPYSKLPYLFFYGNQNTGKTMYYKALALLMTRGVVPADRALTNQGDFNGELANGVLAFIEEKEVALKSGAYSKMKDWTTNDVIWIHMKGKTPFEQYNTLHFIQCANDRESLAIKAGDSRITMFFVPELEVGQEIPFPVLCEILKEEAPHFMRTVMDLQLPPMVGRLRLQVVSTGNKERAEASNRSPLEMFIDENCFVIPGALLEFGDFHKVFVKWLADEEIEDAAKHSAKMSVIRSLPQGTVYGTGNKNKRYIGNFSFTNTPAEDSTPWGVRNGRLKR